jgi:WD40 repeat protein
LAESTPLVQTNASARVLALDWSRTGNLLAVGTSAGELFIFDGLPEALKEAFRQKFTERIQSVRWSPDGKELAFVCDNTDICILRMADTTAQEFRIADRFFGQGDVTGIRWSPDGKQLASIASDNTVRIWSRIQNHHARYSLRTETNTAIRTIGFDVRSGGLAAGDSEGGIWVWDATGDTAKHMPRSQYGGVVSIAWSGSGTIGALHENGTVALLQPSTGYVRLEKPAGSPLPRISWLAGAAVVPLRSGRVALVPSEPNIPVSYVELPASKGAEIYSVIGHPDGHRLYASYTDGSIHLWDLSTSSGGPVVTAEQAGPQAEGAGSLAISPDGRWLTATRNDAVIVVYDLEGKTLPRLLELDAPVTHTVAFGPDGMRLAALAADGRVYVWDLDRSTKPRLLSVAAVPDRSNAGRAESQSRRATWLTWYGTDQLAVSTIAGEVEVLVLDSSLWRSRAALVRGASD